MIRNLASVVFVMLVFLSSSFAQQQAPEKRQPPYKQTDDMPAFNLLERDSSAIFNTYTIEKGYPSVLMFFSPDCDHCQKQVENIISKMDSLKGINFYLMTPMSLPVINAFYEKYQLKKYKNIHLYKDYEYFFPRFYDISSVPYFAVYDESKKFLKLYHGNLNITELLEMVE